LATVLFTPGAWQSTWSTPGAATAAGDTDFSSAPRGRGGQVAVGGNRTTDITSNRRANVNVSRRTNVNVVARRPYRGWVHRPYYGRVIAGVTLGTIIAVYAVGVAPAAPAPNMCWYWSDLEMSQGYWDYCQAP
jgi:hypothetical protein